MKSTKITTQKIVLTGLMAALVFVSNYISIPVAADSRVHVANAVCLLAAFLLGPVYGGLAAGIGSMFFDLLSPLYIASAPFTLVFKFLMAFVCGCIAFAGNANAQRTAQNIFAAIAGALTYMLLYLGKNVISDVYFLHLESQTVWINLATKATASSLNAIFAVIVSILLAIPLHKILTKSGLLPTAARKQTR